MAPSTIVSPVRDNFLHSRPGLRACLEIAFWVAQATGLCRPATRRTEWGAHRQRIRTAFCWGSALLVPVDGSPTGTGGSPVLPVFQARSKSSSGFRLPSWPRTRNSESLLRAFIVRAGQELGAPGRHESMARRGLFVRLRNRPHEARHELHEFSRIETANESH